MLHQRPRNQVLMVVSRLEKGSDAEEDQKNPQELQGGEQTLNCMSIVIIIVIVR